MNKHMQRLKEEVERRDAAQRQQHYEYHRFLIHQTNSKDRNYTNPAKPIWSEGK